MAWTSAMDSCRCCSIRCLKSDSCCFTCTKSEHAHVKSGMQGIVPSVAATA
jgi:hypothetical protein